MSRNLASTHCDFCGAYPTLIETPRPITPEEAGQYFAEYEGLLVANADCPCCGAWYLAWVDERERVKKYPGFSDRFPYEDGVPFVDLSFRSTFNDEPGQLDLPWNQRKRRCEGMEEHDRNRLRFKKDSLEMEMSEDEHRDVCIFIQVGTNMSMLTVPSGMRGSFVDALDLAARALEAWGEGRVFPYNSDQDDTRKG